jgi:hypothetical protein
MKVNRVLTEGRAAFRPPGVAAGCTVLAGRRPLAAPILDVAFVTIAHKLLLEGRRAGLWR